MAENAYGLTADSVKKVQGIVLDYKNQFNTSANRFQSDIASERGQNWKGEAAEAFTALSQTWGEKAQTIITLLQRFHDGLDATNKAAVEASLNSVDGLKQAQNQISDAAAGHLNARLG